MDVITDVLNTLRFNGNVFIHSNFDEQWGAQFQPVNLPVFHSVLLGSCWIKSDQEESFIELQAGDVCFLPNGIGHTIASSPSSNCRNVVIKPGQICIKSDVPDDRAETRLLCGVFQSDYDFHHPIFTTLPEVMHIAFSKDVNGHFWGQHAGYAIDNAINNRSAGVGALTDRLYEILFIQVLQRFFYQNSDIGSFYSNHRSPRVNRVLEAIHADPGADWSLDNMAELAHMSRSTFTSNFRKLIGMSPMSYLNSWRMLKARSLVKTTGLPLKIIAHKVGFRTQSGLNKAFRRFFDFTPKSLRKKLFLLSSAY